MRRYQDLPFRVFDGKNVGRDGNSLVNRDTQLNDEIMLKIMSSVINEVAKLIDNGIRLGEDNFNLCESQGALHLYFNDLGSMSVSEIPEDDFPRFIEYYSMWAIGAFVNSVNHDTYTHNPYVHEMGDLGHSLQSKFEEAVNQKLTQPKNS